MQPPPRARRALSRPAAGARAAAAAAPPPPPAAAPLPLLLTFSAVHANPATAHLADNDHILTGYLHRPGLLPALAGLLTLHNESANIYTHLVGAGIVLRLAAAVALAPAGAGLVAGAGCAAPPAPTWPLLVFLCGAATCLLFSVVYHGLSTVSRSVSEALNVLDYLGISFLIFTSMVPPTYYAFQPRHAAAGATWLALSLALNCGAGVLGTVPFFRAPAFRHVRALAYVACGAAGVLPLLHFMWLSRGAGAAREWALGEQLLARSALMGAQYIAGAALFGLRVPERFAPGRFDYFPSHAFFHVLVVTAVLTHWGTVKGLWLWRSCGAETLF